MKVKVFAIYDSKATAYLQPFFMRSAGEAIRAFENTAIDPNSMFNKNPEDYSLFQIGEFDESEGTLIDEETKVHLANAHHVIATHNERKMSNMPNLTPALEAVE